MVLMFSNRLSVQIKNSFIGQYENTTHIEDPKLISLSCVGINIDVGNSLCLYKNCHKMTNFLPSEVFVCMNRKIENNHFHAVA